MTKVHAYRLISSAEIADNIKSNQLVTPTFESQLRPLTRLPVPNSVKFTKRPRKEREGYVNLLSIN